MLEPVIVAGSISGLISLIGLLYVIFTKLGKLEMKVCTLWKIYGEDVLERAVREGLGKHESPVQITEKGEQVLGEDMKQRIETIVRKNFRFKHDDLLYEVLNKTADNLKERAKETDTDMNLLVGATMLYTQKVLKNQR